MCGRYTSTSTPEELASVFGVEEVRAEPIDPRWNVAPTMPVYAVALASPSGAPSPGGGGRVRALGTFRWGLVPSWAQDASGGARMINARAETVMSKPAFRSAVARRRCLIPADAFYEWQRRTVDGRPAGKLPFAVRRRDGMPMAFAGIWEVWRDRADPEGAALRSCAVVTTSANSTMAPIHDRMPVILEPESWSVWLDPGTGMSVVEGLMVPAAEGVLEAFAVSSRVNNVRHDGPDLLEPLPPPPGLDPAAGPDR